MRTTRSLLIAVTAFAVLFLGALAFAEEGLAENPVRKRFKALDTNNDGKITFDEFRAAQGRRERPPKPRADKGAAGRDVRTGRRAAGLELSGRLQRLRKMSPEERRTFVERLSPEKRRRLQQLMRRGSPSAGPKARKRSGDMGRQGRVRQRLERLTPQDRRALWGRLPEERRMQFRERLGRGLGGERSYAQPGARSQWAPRQNVPGWAPHARGQRWEGARRGFAPGGAIEGRRSFQRRSGAGRHAGRPDLGDRRFDRPRARRGWGAEQDAYGWAERPRRMHQQKWAPARRRENQARRQRRQSDVSEQDILENWDLLQDLDLWR